MTDKDFSLEQEYFKRVRAFLESEIKRLSEVAAEEAALVKKEGKKFNEDNPNGGMYSGMELTDLHYEMEKQMASAEKARLDSYFYNKLKDSPYFARVDFVPDSTSNLRKIYIGLRLLQDPSTFRPLVCDWRAPVSQLFYEEFTDRAWFNAPAGRVEGSVTLRRQFTFKNAALSSFVDSDIKIDDDILRNALSGDAGERLKVIVGSIQREQNRAIRYSQAKNLCVIGPAGSGKTSIGFHRLAYLLYRDRTELSSSEIVMFSNNDIFSSYVADIIPELGEMPINYASFYSVFKAELPDYRVLDYYDLADSAVSGDNARKARARIMFSPEFIKYLEAYAEKQHGAFEDIVFLDNTVLTAAELAERFLSDTENNVQLRSDRLAAYAKGVVDEYFHSHADEIYEAVDAESALDEDTDKVIIARRRALKHEVGESVRRATLTNACDIARSAYLEFTQKTGIENKACAELPRDVLDFPEALCAVFVKCVMGTAAQLPSVKQVLVDEAQDLCLLQHIIIKRMFLHAKYTLLADSNQAIVPELNSTDLNELSSLYNADIFCLDKSYRSTEPINRFALSLLPEDKKYEIFEREGEKVGFINASEPTRAVSDILSEYKKYSSSVAIITKTVSEARYLYKELMREGVSDLHLCDTFDSLLNSAVTVIPLVLTKGLEFDSVIVDNTGGGFDGDGNKAYLYMAATRALHRLTVLSGKSS